MDWLNGTGEQRAVTGQAIRIADGLTLPFHAWSLTRAEVTRAHRRLFLGAAIVYLAVLIPIAWSVRGELEKDPVPALAFVGATALVGGLLVLMTWYWARRAADYRDPQIMIAVGEHGLTVQSPDATQSLYWQEIDAKLLFYSGKSGLQFRGVELATSQGRVPLEDDWYRNGRLAAAVVVRGIHAAHDERQKSRIERIG